MKRKLIFYISILTTLLFVGISTVYAYFESKIFNEAVLTFSASEETTQEITSYNEFIKYSQYYSLSSKKYNTNNKQSIASDRFTLNVTQDIKLLSNITITSDCNINIATGKKIDLNGYSLTIDNVFDGAMYINGDEGSITSTNTIENTINDVIVNCPYSAVIFENNVIDEVNVEKIVISENSTEIINSAFRFIYANLHNIGVNEVYSIAYNEARVSNHECSVAGTHTDNSYGCLYTYTDLELIYNYLTYDLEISYLSGDTSKLSNEGNIVEDITESSIVPLTITIEGVPRTIDVHLVEEADYGLASLNVINEYLYKYYGQELSEDGTLVENSYLYQFDGPLMLPVYDSYFNQSYVYTLSDANTQTDSTIYVSSLDEVLSSDYFELINADKTDSTEKDYYILYIDSKINYLSINVVQGPYISLPIKQLGADMLQDNESYAAGFMRDLYGNQIDIYEEEDKYSGYTETYLLTTPNADVYTYSKISSVTYSILGDSDGTYEIVTGKVENGAIWLLLRHNVNATVKPNITQTIFLQAEFDFAEGDDPIVQTSIVFSTKKQDDDSFGFDDFIQFYTYFNREFIISSNNFTYNDFSIPFSFGTNPPGFTFKVYEREFDETLNDYVYRECNDGLFTFKLVYEDGTNGEVTYVIDELIKSGTNPGTIIHTAISTGTARLVVDINPYYINMNTTEYKFIYVPIYYSGTTAYYLWDDGTGSKQYNTIYPSVDANGNVLELEWVRILPEKYINADEEEVEYDYVTEEAVEGCDYISELSVPGIVRYQCSSSIATTGADGDHYEQFYDYNLYKLIYDLIYEPDYSEGSEDENKYVEGVTFIETDLLSEVIYNTYDETTQRNYFTLATGTYESLRGVQLLKNVKVLEFDGFYLLGGDGKLYTGSNGVYYLTHQISNIKEITYLSQMTGLEELYLQNAGLQDYAVADTSLPNGDGNNFLGILSSLYNLKILDISNATDSTTHLNKIYEMAALQDFASLQYVDVSNITFESTMSAILGFDIGGLFEEVSNSLYGSGGAANIGVKSILQSRGVTTIGFTIRESTLSNAAYIIANLEHQELLSTNISLASVISQYVQGNTQQVYSHYGLISKYDLSSTDLRFILELSSVAFSVIYPTDEAGNVTSTAEKDIKSFKFEITYTYEAVSKGYLGDIGGLGSETKTGTISFAYTYKVERY